MEYARAENPRIGFETTERVAGTYGEKSRGAIGADETRSGADNSITRARRFSGVGIGSAGVAGNLVCDARRRKLSRTAAKDVETTSARRVVRRGRTFDS